MTSPSPTCLVNGASTINGVAVSPGATVTIQLADTTGVVTWDIRCISTDELNTTSGINAGLSITDPIARTATFTAPASADGAALIFQSTVNGGVDLNGRAVASYRTTFKVKVMVGSLEVLATNETTEGNASHGWTAPLNAAIRAAATGGGGGGGGFAAGGDLSGTATNQTVVSLTGSAGVVTGPATALTLGTSPSSVGFLRFPAAAAATTMIGVKRVDVDASYALLTHGNSNVTFGNYSGLNLELTGYQTTLTSLASTTFMNAGGVAGGLDYYHWYIGHTDPGRGGGDEVLSISNATTNPSTNPTNGIVLYVDAADGYVKYRKADGAVIALDGSGSGGGGSFTAGGDLTGSSTSQTVAAIQGTTINSVPASGNLVGTTDAQTLTNKTLTTPIVTTLTIPDSDASHNYIFSVGNISANRTISLPALTGNDTFTFNAASQTLTNKTINASNNTLSNIANSHISASAAIAYSKLNLAGSIVNADVSASAAIAYSKLSLTGSIVNADINSSAAIDVSKLAAGSNGQVIKTVDGVVQWDTDVSGGAGGSPGGSDTQVQFNDGGSFGGDAGFTYNKTSDVLTVAGGIALTSGTMPSSGLIRLPYDGTNPQNVIVRKDSTAADVALMKFGAGDSWTFGDTTHSGFINAYALQVVSLSGAAQLYASGGFHFYDYASSRYGATIQGNGIQIGNTITGDFGGGVGVIGIDDASTVPTTNPTSGVILYSEGGALKFRNPSGTVTTIGSGGGFTAGGDLSGTSSSQTVDRIKGTTITTAGGALPVGAVLRTTAAGTADWGTVDLADSDAVTGTLAITRGGTGVTSIGGAFVGTTEAQTLTNKTIDGASNTITNVSLTTGVTGTLPVANGGTGITSLGTGVATFLGTPSGANLASALTTALPASKGGTGLTALGTNVATWLGTPSSANLAAAITDETGTGELVFSTTPTFKTSVRINNPANTFAYTLTPAAIAANRTINLPLLTAADTMVTAAFSQTLTNKTIAAGSNTITGIANANIDAAAAIAYSKLNLATSIVNADISGSAAIAYSKLNLATSIVNADISTSAAIAVSKLAAGTDTHVLTTVAGVPTWAAPTGGSSGVTFPRSNNTSTGTLNDVSTSSVNFIKFTNATGPTVTGFANGSDGKALLVYFNAAGTIAHESASSTAANRIAVGSGANISVAAGTTITLVYDGDSSRWRPVGAEVLV